VEEKRRRVTVAIACHNVYYNKDIYSLKIIPGTGRYFPNVQCPSLLMSALFSPLPIVIRY